MKISPSSSIHLTKLPSHRFDIAEDDDFQDYPSPSLLTRSTSLPLKPHNQKPLKKPKPLNPGKENPPFYNEPDPGFDCGLDSIQPSLDLFRPNPIEPRLLKDKEGNLDDEYLDEEGSTKLDLLIKMCAGDDESENGECRKEDWEGGCEGLICCPLCGVDISGLGDDEKQVHTNECLDNVEEGSTDVEADNDDDTGAGHVVDGSPFKSAKNVIDVSPVVEWLRNLGLARYEQLFISQEIDWDALQCLTEEDLCVIGVSALGPRKKILHALKEMRNGSNTTAEPTKGVSKSVADETKSVGDENKVVTNKLITDFFLGPPSVRRRVDVTSTTDGRNGQNNNVKKGPADSGRKSVGGKGRVRNVKQKDVPLWCCIPGTPFRVDAFKYLRRDFSYWFLTHFHLDHYQGLTRSFCHGKIYCSSITAKLLNLKIGIPYDKIEVLPLNQKINIAGTDVTCFDANHCPGAIIILFEPPNGKPVLHTGDFRYSEAMSQLSLLHSCSIHTLILDTTYCDSQYDFPKQEAVIQFVIDAIQAEAFNPKTLFLIGSYTIGKERLFIEVARALRKKVYVGAAKLRLLECLGLEQEDMQWLTLNEHESHIHVVPMWTIASFKRLKLMSNQYMSRYSLIVAFSPTGWSFGKGKKSTGRRSQQGTIIRYEVPYSEHSSFTELKEFVKFVSPVEIIPSVNNNSPDSHNSMVSQLLA